METNITPQHFDPLSQFGNEQALRLQRHVPATITQSALLRRLRFTVESIDPEKQAAIKHVIDEPFLVSLLGDGTTYNIQEGAVVD